MSATVYFATNREVRGGVEDPCFGKSFHNAGPWYLRFGAADLEETDGGSGYRPVRVRLAPEAIPGVTGPSGELRLGSQEIFENLRREMQAGEADVLVFLHGFSCGFEAALTHSAGLSAAYGEPGRPLHAFAFSWPADGEMVPMLSYLRDRDDAKLSGEAMARAFLKLLDFFRSLGHDQFCRRSIHLVAHSMGNYALRHALQAIISKYDGGPLPRVFQNILLMAADEDNDTFEHAHKLARLPELAEAVHVYYAANDMALHVSDRTKGNPDRLGTTGPRTLGNLPLKINLVDCRDVAATGLDDGCHQYYRLRPEVLRDVRQVLSGMSADAIGGRVYVPDKRAFRIMPD